jgi:hypothetical protein
MVLPGWNMIHDSLTSGSSAIGSGHGRLGVALVEENEPVGVDIGRPLAPVVTLLDDLRIELLLSPQRLFFRVIFSRLNDRQIVMMQPSKPMAWPSSSSVASGDLATADRRESAASPWIKSLRPPALGLGAIEPVFARCARSLRIHRAETENRRAMSCWESSPASTAATTRCRRSKEYATTPASLIVANFETLLTPLL